MILLLAVLPFLLLLFRRGRRFLGRTRKFLAGHPLDGQLRTNATFTRGATRVLHPTGRAHSWHWRPGWQRGGIRLAVILLAVTLTWAAFFHPVGTVWVLAVPAAACIRYGAWRVYRDVSPKHQAGPLRRWAYPAWDWRDLRRNRRKFAEDTWAAVKRPWVHYWRFRRPLRHALTEEIGAPPTRLEIEPDRSKVVVGVPVEFTGSDGGKKAIERAVTAKLAIPDAEPSWRLHDRKPCLTLIRAFPPPRRLALDAILPDIVAAKPHEIVWGIGKRDERTITSWKGEAPFHGLSMGTGKGKALALDTRIPTPSGWTTMGEITAGDVVFDETGAPCTVTDAWAVRHGRPCYEIEFSDGTIIVADAEHQWVAETRASRRTVRPSRPAPKHPRSRPEVVTTEVMAATLHRESGHLNYSIRVAGTLQCPAADLPVPPYVLGAWLGDGHTACSSITSADAGIISEIEAEGETTWPVPSSVKANHADYNVKGLRPRLREIGVLGNKHIPVAYLRASEPQRRALLAGLLDTDGCCSGAGQVEFVSTKERLAYDVLHLVATLGYKPGICREAARLYGKDCGPKWRVRFTPADKVFRLPRKTSRQVVKARPTSGRRYVTAVRPIPSVPVRCIAVDSPSHLYLAGDACIPTHNSETSGSGLAQACYHGAIGIVLDVKMFSHQWAKGLPNVAYARTAAEVTAMLMWLEAEVRRRNEVADAEGGVDKHGNLIADVGPPLFVIFEELNATQGRVAKHYRLYIKEKGDPAKAPAIDALDDFLFTARQVLGAGLLVAQRLSAKSISGAGGNADARENVGAYLMCDPSLPVMKMTGWEHPLPPATGHPGRIQVVTASAIQETQAVLMTPEEKRWLATAGKVAEPRWDMPLIGKPVPSVPTDDRTAIDAGPGPDSPIYSELPVLPGITLREAVEAGVFGSVHDALIPRKVEAVRKKLQRDPGAPSPLVAGYKGGPAHRYDEEALHEYAAK